MEDIRSYRYDIEPALLDNENPVEWEVATSEDEVPYHIPRD